LVDGKRISPQGNFEPELPIREAYRAKGCFPRTPRKTGVGLIFLKTVTEMMGETQ
jgi:hypothetical protein